MVLNKPGPGQLVEDSEGVATRYAEQVSRTDSALSEVISKYRNDLSSGVVKQFNAFVRQAEGEAQRLFGGFEAAHASQNGRVDGAENVPHCFRPSRPPYLAAVDASSQHTVRRLCASRANTVGQLRQRVRQAELDSKESAPEAKLEVLKIQRWTLPGLLLLAFGASVGFVTTVNGWPDGPGENAIDVSWVVVPWLAFAMLGWLVGARSSWKEAQWFEGGGGPEAQVSSRPELVIASKEAVSAAILAGFIGAISILVGAEVGNQLMGVRYYVLGLFGFGFGGAIVLLSAALVAWANSYQISQTAISSLEEIVKGKARRATGGADDLENAVDEFHRCLVLSIADRSRALSAIYYDMNMFNRRNSRTAGLEEHIQEDLAALKNDVADACVCMTGIDRS